MKISNILLFYKAAWKVIMKKNYWVLTHNKVTFKFQDKGELNAAYLSVSSEITPPLKISGSGHSWYTGFCWIFCNKFQVVTFRDNLAQFWASSINGLADPSHQQKCLATLFQIWLVYKTLRVDHLGLDHLPNWSSPFLAIMKATPMTTPTRADPADLQIPGRALVLDVAMLLENGNPPR